MSVVQKTSSPWIPEIKRRLITLMFSRVILASVFLGATIFFQIKATKTYFGHIQYVHFLLIAAIYFLTIIYLLFYKYVSRHTTLAYAQLAVDVFLVTCIVYSTGGTESIFSFLYFLVIITASIMLYRKGGVIISTISSLLYGGLLILHYYGIIHPLGSHFDPHVGYKGLSIFFVALVNIFAFYLVCFLTSFIAESANKSRIALRAKEHDVDQLELLNESIIKSIGSALFAVDERQKIIMLNPAAESLFNIDSSTAVGQNITEILPFIKNHPLEPTTGFRDISITSPEGKQICLRYSVSPLKTPSGNNNGLIFIIQDITKLKKIEQEMKKVEGLAMVGELAAGIAHEIRNPMASISGSIQMLKEEMAPNEIHARLMDIVLREINRLNNLVNDFLLFARPKKSSPMAFDLNQLIIEALELFKNSTHWSNKVSVQVDLTEHLKIVSDQEQLKQVLWNLFVNACEAMPDGGALYITTEKTKNNQGINEVIIRVRDTGNGFDKESLKQLFVPFFTTKDRGSGLGLAIVKRIIDELGGNVTGTNHPQGGALLTITLPLQPAG